MKGFLHILFSKIKIHYLCYKYDIKKYHINSDLSIDVYDDVYLNGKDLTKIPIKFNIIYGTFSISNNFITSLKNSPNTVFGEFFASNCILTSLEYCPLYVERTFDLFNNNITEVTDSPIFIGGSFELTLNIIEKINLKKSCEIGGKLYISYILGDYIQKYKKMIFEHGYDYGIFNDNGTINDTKIKMMLRDFD